MNKKILWLANTGVILVLALIALFVWGSEISPENNGVMYNIEQGVQSIIVLAIAWILTKIVSIIFLEPLKNVRQKSLPNIIKDVVKVCIYCFAVMFIVTKIYNQSLLSISAIFISSWTVIGFAAKDVLGDCINGVSIDWQANIEVGDWVKFKDGTIAQVVKMKMTRVDLMLPDSTALYVTNTTLNSEPIINLSKPTREYYIGISVVLEHSVPVSRARRILHAAISNAEGIYKHDANVFAESVQANGVVYVIHFKIPDRGVWLECRHQVINAVTKQLHKFGLKVCQITGEINVRAIEGSAYNLSFNDFYVSSAIEALKMSKLLDNCDDNIQRVFAERMRLLKFKSGDVIVRDGDVGDTMFIIAEGVVDVYISVDNEKDNEDGSLKKITCLVDGDYFGEMALLMGEKRNATVIAKTDVIIYEINRGTIKWFIKEYPDFDKKLSESILSRNEKNSNLRSTLSEKVDGDEEPFDFMKAFTKFLWKN